MEKTIGGEIKQLNNMLSRRMEGIDTVKSGVMTCMHGWVIGYLYDHEDSDVFQKDIERFLHVRRSTVTDILQRMEFNGLIERKSIEGDGRLKKIVLTERGKQTYLLTKNSIERIEEDMQEGISEEEMELFFCVADKIKKNLVKGI